ncbi:MAG: calcium/sodium antiporter [Candidatus Eremiobacteraeota bacterium]|nr:calcium/sodium antiporter [Candidatus Eremiobacteraeota bacterium]
MIYVLFILGFVLIIKGADFLIQGSSSLAGKMGISPMIIGLTVVAFGTSVPELVINVFSALSAETTDIALGNIVGSCISNILLILGLTAAIFPLKVKVSTVWKELLFSLFAVGLLFVMANDIFFDNTRESVLGRTDGIILLSFFGIFLYYVIVEAMNDRKEHQKETRILEEEEYTRRLEEGEDQEKGKAGKASPALDENGKECNEEKGYVMALKIFAGLIALCFGGKWIVDGAVVIATKFGMSQYLISATIIAVGSSLPELVTSLVAAYKKEPDLSVGNIVGSNIFNILWVLGVTCIIRPIPVPLDINVDLIFLILITVYLFLFLFVGKKYKLERWQGISFTILYIFYVVYIIMRKMN